MFSVSLLFDRDSRGSRAEKPSAAALSHAVLSLFAAVVTQIGCTTAPFCEPLTRCGGDLTAGAKVVQGVTQSEWVASTNDSCMDQVQLPVTPVSLAQQPARTAGKKGAAPATVDWCSSLSQKADGTLRYQPFFPIIPLKNAHLKLFPNGKFDAHFVAGAPQQMAFSAACRAAQGVSFTCPELGRHIKAAIAAESNVTDTRCYDDGEGGCTCDYYLRLFTSQPGSWGAADGMVTFYDESGANLPAAPADYCVKAENLELTGHNGQQLFNRPDLRTLTFHRPGCSDGLQDGDEDGIDCGGSCGTACGTCSDGAQNGDELGVDCGGECLDFCGCFNQVQDAWEEGLDCGGPCSLQCSCKNGTKDATEAGVDCGGECQVYFSGSPVACQ
jgi:hypothetical protein